MLKNVYLYTGRRQADGSFNIYISFSGNETDYLMTQRKCAYIYNNMKSGIRLDDLERLSHRNIYGQRSNEAKNSIKHILMVANDYITYEYNYSHNNRRAG